MCSRFAAALRSSHSGDITGAFRYVRSCNMMTIPAPFADPADLARWNRLATDTAMLWMEASQVVWLRSMRIATGGKLAEREASRMVSEKLEANWELGWKLLAMAGATPQASARRSVSHYRSKVRANRRRLGSSAG